MKVSKEFLILVNACKNGVVFAEDHKLFDMEHKPLIEYCENNGGEKAEEFSDFVKAVVRTPTAIKYRGKYTVKYLIFNPLTGAYEEVIGMDKAKEKRLEIIEKFVQEVVMPQIDVQQVFESEDGTSSTSKKVEI